MTPEIRRKLAKIYELVKRGTDGEQAAAQAALDRMLDKYGLENVNLEALNKEQYSFTYTTWMEEQLIARILAYLVCTMPGGYTANRRITLVLTYVDYVTLSCAYEYFRKHMKGEWNRLCAPLVAKCRKGKTKAKRRAELSNMFFARYCIESGLFRQQEVILSPVKSVKELEANKLMMSVEGGKYNRQVVTGHLLTA